MLEKAILVDQLNSKISHRPGPLELIEKNILHTNEPIEKIVKEGLLPFKVGSEDEVADKNFLSFEDDSQSSEGDLFQANLAQTRTDVIVKQEVEEKRPNEVEGKPIFDTLPSTSSGNIINISLVPSNSSLLATSSTPISVGTFKIINASGDKSEISTTIPLPPPPPKLELISSLTYHVKPVKGIINTQNFLPIQLTEAPTVLATTPSQILPVQTHTPNQHVSSFIQNNQSQKYSAPGKDKNRKKSKNKVVSKRTIKFHEYKGPTNKNNPSSTVTSTTSNSKKVGGETNFDLIMQQQCLLEYLENIYKNPHVKSENEKSFAKQIKIESSSEVEDSDKSSKIFNKPHVTIFPSKPQPSSSIQSELSKDTTVTDVSKLSKMKVSELKAYLKRINLPVSGPKPILIERLKPYLPLKPLENFDDCSETSVSVSDGNDFYNSSLHSVSSTESEMDGTDPQCMVSSSIKDDDIVVEQQRKIEELQRKLQESQQELEQIKQIKQVDTNIPNVVFDNQEIQRYQLPTVFVVQPTPENQAGKIQPVILEATSTSLSQKPEIIELNSPVDEPTSSNEIEKESPVSTPIAQDQDISDVLEILLKNGEWPEIPDGNFNQITNESDNTFIENVLSGQVMSPMLHEEAIDKILGEFILNFNQFIYFYTHKLISLDTVVPENQSTFPQSFSDRNTSDFPISMEVDDSLLMSNADFNRNFSPSDFIEKSPKDVNGSFNISNLNMENCDNHYSNSLKSSQEEVKPQKNRNGLIGNFDHNVLFDSLKSNSLNNNNNNGNELFLISQDPKFVKDDSKSLINNLQLSHNFDTIFNNSIESQMDFESIIPYSSEPNDLFQMTNGNFNSSIFNDDGMDLNF